jgi:hypothetical protein
VAKKLKRVKIKGGPEKMVLTGLIVSSDFIQKIEPIYNRRSMSSRWARIIADWCFDYYKEFNKAPQKAIRDIYDCEQAKLTPEDAELVKTHLRSLNDEYERADLFNLGYSLKQANFFFKQRSLSKLSEEIESLIDQGKVEEAEALQRDFDCPTVEREQINNNILTDPQTLKAAFQAVETPLIQFTGALGQHINEFFVRKGFVALMGPEKRGKTWWLNEICLQALKCRCKVLYINCGDMDNLEQSVRFSIRISGRNAKEEYCGKFTIPVLDCIENQDDSCVLAKRRSLCGVMVETPEGYMKVPFSEAPKNYIPCSECKHRKGFKGASWFKQVTVDKPLTWKEAFKINKKFEKHTGTDKRFKMESFSNGTFSPADLKARIERFIREEGWLPDIIIADYADIMDPGTQGDFRQSENYKWKSLRALCQDYNILLVTATQTDAASYSVEVIKEQNFSEDKRKFSHVTGIITLNQNEVEGEIGIMRLGKLMNRFGAKTNRLVTVLQSLRQGRPNIGAYYSE